jgi:pilus assembly protein TadC
LVESVPFFQGFLYSAARALVGLITPVNEQGELTTANSRYLLLLQQADWYWAPGELSPPTPAAPFWNLETLWGTKVVSALAGGALGFVVLLVPSLALGLPSSFIVAPLFGAFIGALQGWIAPDGKLKAAVKKRQHGITVEMAFRLSELAAYVSTGKSIARAFRYLAGRPGGPFVAEIRRLLAVYDATSSLPGALERLIERNRMRALTEFGQQIMMVEQKGGSIGPALNVLSQAAQRNLKQRLEEQAADNAAQMGLPVSGGSMLVVFLLVGGPALYIVLSSL